MKKLLKITGITLAVILAVLLLLFLTPFIFEKKFEAIIKNTANKTLKTEMNFREMDLSFFHHFPNLTITLSGFSLKSSAPFSKDTLIRARDISFGVNLLSAVKGPLRITRVYLNKARVEIKYNEKGASNFDVYNSSPDTTTHADTASMPGASLRIEHIAFIQSDFIYSDPSIPMKLIAHGINYSGTSEVTNDILRLTSRVKIDSLDFYYNRIPYLKSKPVTAGLTTSINLNSLDMKFEKDNFSIKDIPFEFKGELAFRKNGYSFFISLFSMFGDQYLSGSLMLNSAKNLWISAKADVNLDLKTWSKGLGIDDVSLGGMFSMKLKAQGEIAMGQNPASKKPDTILLGIPDFSFSSGLKDGSFRYRKFPQALSGISFSLNASSHGHDYRAISVQLENLKAEFMKNRIEGYFRLKGLNDFPVESRFSTSLDLAGLKQLVPLDSLELGGKLDLDLDIKGNYAPAKKLFPLTQLHLKLADGMLRTKYYPRPVETIWVDATVTNSSGKISGTRVKLDPASFSFEGNPFTVTADLSNPDDLDYNVVSKGSIDIASIYHVFSQKGMDLKGFISTDLNLKGRQSDAMAGRLDKLQNSGKLIIRDIAFTSEYLPKPLVVKSGVFRFENDKIWFEKFESRYGASDITLNGHISNILNYCLSKNQPLKGSLNFSSTYLLADEFMAPENQENGHPGNIQAKENPDAASAKGTSPQETKQAPPGVIVIPDNLEIGLKTDLKKISFRKLDISDFSATVEVKKGMLLLKDMTFGIVGCKVGMEATYGSLSENKAFFDFHIKAEDFDVKRAYNEIELFRNLSTAAGKCEGIISLDYSLKGKLSGGMNPVYPSLEGGGVVSLKKIKVMGLKLFTAMSKNLEKEKINEPDLSKVEIRSSIKNNVITIEKTKMKISGFRFRIGGETSFDGKLNFKARLGLPPLGIVGIPMRILGTSDNPKFKYGRGSKDEDLDETEYSDEIPKDMLDKIKSAKEEDLKDEEHPN
jgi:AsmA protein